MVWEKNLVPTEDDMKEIEEREYEFEDASDMLARWICNGGEITDDIFEKAYKEINFILKTQKFENGRFGFPNRYHWQKWSEKFSENWTRNN